MAVTGPTPLTVLLIDHSDISRSGLGRLLEGDARFTIVAETARDGPALARLLRPDLIVIDPRTDGRIDVPLIAELHETAPVSRIAVVSDLFEARSLLAAVLAGAQAYLLKTTAEAEFLRDALASVGRRGLLSIDPAIVEHYRGYPPGALELRAPSAAAPDLSERERLVLQRLSEGLTRAEIAEREHLSLSSVKRDIAKLEAKFDVRNSSLLLLKAERLGLLFEEPVNESGPE